MDYNPLLCRGLILYRRTAHGDWTKRKDFMNTGQRILRLVYLYRGETLMRICLWNCRGRLVTLFALGQTSTLLFAQPATEQAGLTQQSIFSPTVLQALSSQPGSQSGFSPVTVTS